MLTLPLVFAALSAGLVGGVHCVGMCGGIAHFLSQAPGQTTVIPLIRRDKPRTQIHQTTWAHLFRLHSGRLSSYALIGALFGGLGNGLLAWAAMVDLSSWRHGWFVLGNLALLLLAFRLAGLSAYFPRLRAFHRLADSLAALIQPLLGRSRQNPFMTGLAWGFLPCGLSYAIAPFAMISGEAISGAILMLVFGFSALPHLLLAQHLTQRRQQHPQTKWLAYVFALLLAGLGVFGLFFAHRFPLPAFLCVTP